MKDLGLAIALAISLHPVVYILFDRKYRCGTNISLYLKNNLWSRLATNPLIILSSIGLAFFGIFYSSYILFLPLSILTWKLFISDRFITLSRGQGAPGYFCYFNTLTILLYLLGGENYLLKQFCVPLQAIVMVEFGAIFFSAGTFKFVDSIKGNNMAFALGLLNPMWSKIYRFRAGINQMSAFINFLGPSLQVISGFLIVTGIKPLMKVGYALIGLMFLSITPQTRLSWLCPAIAAGAYLSYTLMASYESTIYGSAVHILFALTRIRIMWTLFVEYFAQGTTDSLSQSVTRIYRVFLGVIIWKVFTFDIVKYICARNPQSQLFTEIYDSSRHTNVYDSITLVSLISSKAYIPLDAWNLRMQRALTAYGLECLRWIEIVNSKNSNDNDSLPRFIPNDKYHYLINMLEKNCDVPYDKAIECNTARSFMSYKKVGL